MSEKNNKKILVMPGKNICVDDKDMYFKKWHNLLNNNKLIEFIEKNDINIYLYSNRDIDKLKFNSNNITITKNIQDLLKDSSLLITDYSNIYITFASMLKPVIYYQSDEYQKSNKHNRVNLFGKILSDEEDVINRIIGYTNMNYKIEKFYKKRINNYFGLEEL